MSTRATDAAFRKLVRKLLKITVELEQLGENEMGVLNRRTAARFHRATDTVRRLTVDLTQDVAWPHEPGFPAVWTCTEGDCHTEHYRGDGWPESNLQRQCMACGAWHDKP